MLPSSKAQCTGHLKFGPLLRQARFDPPAPRVAPAVGPLAAPPHRRNRPILAQTTARCRVTVDGAREKTKNALQRRGAGTHGAFALRFLRPTACTGRRGLRRKSAGLMVQGKSMRGINE